MFGKQFPQFNLQNRFLNSFKLIALSPVDSNVVALHHALMKNVTPDEERKLLVQVLLLAHRAWRYCSLS